MFTERGIVTKIERDLAWVNTQSRLACSSCRVESTCGNAILEKYLGGKVFVSIIKNELEAKVGDKVTIAIPKSSVKKASFIVYWLSLMSLLLGALIGHSLFNSEVATITGCLLGLLFGILLAVYYSRGSRQLQQYIPKMVDKQSAQMDPDASKAIEFGFINVTNMPTNTNTQ